MEKSKTISLLESVLECPDSFDGLVKISQASKIISNSLVFSDIPLAIDHEILKLLIYLIPINPHNTLFLIETILTKYQANHEIIQNCWRVFEFIANIEDQEQSLSLHKKFLQQTLNSSKKTIKILPLEEEYLLKKIVDLKTNILKLLPNLFALAYKNYPETMIDKSNSQTESILSTVDQLIQIVAQKYCPQLKNTQRHPVINKTKKNAIKKIKSQNKSAVQKSILEESVATNSEDLYQLLKSQTRLETFLTYIISPKAISADSRIWFEFEHDQNVEVEMIRKRVSMQLLTQKSSLKSIQSSTSDMLVMFFNLVQRYFKETDLNSIIEILQSFWENNPVSVSVIIMQTGFLEKIFYNIQGEIIYNFIYLFTSLKHKWVKEFKPLFYEYFRLSGFFELFLNNMSTKKSQYLDPLKTKQFNEIQVKLESKAIQIKLANKQIDQLKSINISQLLLLQTPYEYQTPSQNNYIHSLFNPVSKTDITSMMGSVSKKKASRRSLGTRESLLVKKSGSPIISLPPFAIKQFRGYYSTSPVINFNTIEIKDQDLTNQNWCYTNNRLYADILFDLITNDDISLIEVALPNEDQLQQMFNIFKKYRHLPLNSNYSNSAIQIFKILTLILRNDFIKSKYSNLSEQCERNISLIYPVINILFHKQKQQTNIQKLSVIKNLDAQIIDFVEFFYLMIKGIHQQKRQDVLNDIDQSLWQILSLWFFDCMLNNIYQTIIYKIFVELFTYGSEILLLNILFKSNFIGSLYNAYSDVMKNGVLITQWHIHSFFIHICKFYVLIKNMKQKRSDLKQLPYGLSKMLSWTLLQQTIKQTFKKDINFDFGEFTI